MDPHSKSTGAFAGTLLPACIVLAQIDVVGLADCAFRAGITGAIWLFWKLIADSIDRYRKAQETAKQEPKP